MDLEEIFREFSIKYTKEPEYYRVLCPFHNDTKPSGLINIKSRWFRCYSCSASRSFVAYLSKVTGLEFGKIRFRLGNVSDVKYPISFNEIEHYHIDIWQNERLRLELYNRCVTDDLIRQYRLGVKETPDGKRIVIPIFNDVGECSHLRLYLPGASTRKFLNGAAKTTEKVRIKLYPIDQMEFDQVLVCGGELKAIAAAKILNQYDVGAVTATSGELHGWPNEYNSRFTGKLVYICSDIDEIGLKSMELRCRILKSFARAVHKVILPLDVKKYPKGDLNDFIREDKINGGDGSALYQLLLDSPEWVYIPGGLTTPDEPKELSFRDAFLGRHVGERLKFSAIITGFAQNQYNIPSLVEVSCPRGQDFCTSCDINSMAYSTNTEMLISPENRLLLALMCEKESNHSHIYKEYFHIPRICQVCKFARKTEYALNEIRMDEEVEATSREEPLVGRSGYLVDGPQVPENHTYVVTGRLYPSPKNQVSCFLISKCEPTLDSLECYRPATKKELEIFTPIEWTVESIEAKLNDIYSDLEANVTQIWRRRDYHIGIDLAYHSLLYLKLGGTQSFKGCVEFLVVGDTAQGKSDAASKMKNHYGKGVLIDCATLSTAGLMMGLEKTSNGFFTNLGVLPRNDKGLVIFEELKKITGDEFSKLTQARSSGLIQISKIHQKTKPARVRLICISNPIEERKVASYAYGIESALVVIGTNEDLRRFDLTMILGEADLPPGGPPERDAPPPACPHKYTADLCQKLVLKAWKCEDVEFEDTDIIMQVTKRLLSKFGYGPPVLDPNSSHLKIAKLSASLAARTNSYEEQGSEKLIVRRCHVEYIEQFLNRVYSSPSCKLDEKSRQIKSANILRHPEELVKFLKETTNIQYILEKILETDSMSSSFIRDLVGDFVQGALLLSRLIQSNALVRNKYDKYSKNPAFTVLIQSTDWTVQKPTYLQKEKF